MILDLGTNFTNHIVGGINNVLPRLPMALFDFLLGVLIIRLIKYLARFIMKATNVQTGLRYVLTSIIETFLWIFLVITLLNDLGFTGVVYFFTGSLAAIGLAMALGGGTLVSDIVAGIFLAQDHDFNVGDEITAGETPTTGIIERMDARRIRIRDEQGVLHVIPNSIVERKEWVVVRRRTEVSALAKATKVAKHIGAVALEKRAAVVQKTRRLRNNAQ